MICCRRGWDLNPGPLRNMLLLDAGTLSCKRFPFKSTTICSILLNEMVASTSAIMVWKSRARMDPLGSLLFPNTALSSALEKMSTRSTENNKAKLPVPGYGTLAANLLARAWNEVPNLQDASNPGAAKSAAKSWARSLKFKL